MPEMRRGRHVVTELHAHIVLVTKYREGVFCDDSLEALERIMRGVCDEFDVTLVEFNGEADHVHILVEYPARVQLSKLINSLKGVSSRMIKKEGIERLNERLGGLSALWSPSYYAGSVGGAPLDVLETYIENQQRPSKSG